MENNILITENKEVRNYRKKGLSETQKNVASELANIPFTQKSINDIAEQYNINRSTIFRWKNNELFNSEVNRISNEIQKSHISVVHNKLLKLLNSNNDKTVLKAIELFYKQQNLLNDNNNIVAIKNDNNINIDTLLNELNNI